MAIIETPDIFKRLQAWMVLNHLRIEFVLISLVLLSFATIHLEMNKSQELVTLSMSLLAVHYFMIGRLTRIADGWLGKVSTGIVSVASAVGVIGLLFTVLHLKGAQEMVLIATPTLMIAGVPLVYYYVKSSNATYLALIARVLVLAILCAINLQRLPLDL